MVIPIVAVIALVATWAAAPGALVLVVVGIATDIFTLSLVGGIAGVFGLAAYEDAFVRAGQSVPLS